MQITLNQTEVSQVVLEYIQNQLALDDSNNFVVELHEDGITVLVNEDSSQPQPSTGSKPAARKPRRTKAQIEADAKAEAEAGKSSDTPTTTTSVVDVKATEAAPVVAAGDTTPEASVSPGTETEVDPQPEVAATVAVDEPVNEPEPEVEPEVEATPEPVKEVEAAANDEQPKPTQSLFANLRRPKN